MATAVTIDELTPDRDDLFDGWLAVRRAADAEVNPGDPPYPLAELTAEVFVPHEHTRYRAWLARIDGVAVGEAVLALETDADNVHVAGVEWLAVSDAFRRSGVATALARVAVDAARDEGRTTFLAWVPAGHPTDAGAWCRRLGMVEASTDRCSRVAVADLDRDLLARWIDDCVAPAHGYHLVQYRDRCPDQYRPALVAANVAMEDMPTDDLDWTVPTYTVADLASREGFHERKAIGLAGTLAIAPDGTAAGFSEIHISRHRPEIAHQGDTGVVPAHRGRGIGRWLKAANLAWAETVSPGFTVIETYNAASNPWMLAINEAMGFRPHVYLSGYQADIDVVRSALG